MPEFRLHSLYPLGGREPLHESLPGVDLQEIAGRSLVSVSARRDGEPALRQIVQERFGVDLPEPGRIAAGSRVAFAWMGRNQWFADAATDGVADLEAELGQVLGQTASLSDQSDGWARLRLSGPRVCAILEKLCMLDLHDDRFPPGTVARTVMEHLGAVIVRPEPGDGFELWSARSSARSFFGAIRLACSSSADAQLD